MPSKNSSQADSEKNSVRLNSELNGIAVSAGIVIGKALVVGKRTAQVSERRIPADEIEDEIERFRGALEESQTQIELLRQRVAKILGEHDARIFDAHLLLVGDELIIDEVIEQIRERGRNAEFIFNEVIDRYSTALKEVDDPYIRDRLADIQDVADRVLNNLRGDPKTDLTHLPAPRIVVSFDLSPSDTAGMDRQNVMGFATCIGSRTSHTAIMARAMSIPAVVGVPDIQEVVATGDPLILDGTAGVVIVRPDAGTVHRYEQRIAAEQRWYEKVAAEASLPAETKDGFRVQLAANVELPEEVDTIRSSYGVGIGLFRTEFLFINREVLPDEEEQFEAYRKVAQNVYPQSVILRTLDLGGDKFMSNIRIAKELNPFLGVRAIRFCLSRPDIFLSQLRAILRASAFGKVRIMFPMISTLEELREALNYLEQAKSDLDARNIEYNPHLDVGTMIEVPAAALIADQLAAYVDFFSIGTNDLVQYALAVDRANSDMAYLYQPCHPAIIQLIRQVLMAAWKHGKWVSMCGEMAGEPILAPLVLGLGIHEFSISPVAIGPVKTLIRSLRLYQAEELVEKSLGCGTAKEVLELCREFVQEIAPDLLAHPQ